MKRPGSKSDIVVPAKYVPPGGTTNMKKALLILGIIAVLSIELYAAYAVFHPHVSAGYRAYFIDRTTSDWCPRHYAATPEQGIVFGKPCWPEFVDTTVGFSNQEDWGRWTDANMNPSPKILMTRKFSGPLCVEIMAHPSPAEHGKKVVVAFGENTGEMTLADPQFVTYKISFPDAKPADWLEFRFAERVPRDQDISPGSQDPRALGMALASVRILPHTCSETTE